MPVPLTPRASQLPGIVLGDWGRKGGDYQRDVARGLGEEAAHDRSRFIISTGDNFYDKGVKSTSDPHWRRSFEEVYTAASLQVPWYAVLGNHDHRGNAQAEIDYTGQSDRWTMPASYFAVEQPVNDAARALFVFLDTNSLDEQSFSEQDIAVALEGPARQLRWLDSTLAASDADWRLVFGHHPLYAVGAEHQDDPVLIGNVRPILERHHVQAYLSGHAHSLQHLRPTGTVDYFISGSGSGVRSVAPNAVTDAAVAVPGYIAASLTPDRMQIQLVDFRGKVHHQVVIECRDSLVLRQTSAR